MGAIYLCVDVGATKTLVAGFSAGGKVGAEYKFATPKVYAKFLVELKSSLQRVEFKNVRILAACCAVPGRVDSSRGVGTVFGNLPWKDAPLREDLKEMLGNLPVFVENDAKLAGVYEAAMHKEYKKVLYLTVSTGIGGGIIVGGKIDPDFSDSEPGQMVLEHNGKLQKWEDFASGRAFRAKYEKKVSEVDNPFVWKEYSKALAVGIDTLAATLQPDAIIIGGGVGAHLEKFIEPLKAELQKYQNDMVKIPPIIKADRAEEAVIYGCYEYIKQSV